MASLQYVLAVLGLQLGRLIEAEPTHEKVGDVP